MQNIRAMTYYGLLTLSLIISVMICGIFLLGPTKFVRYLGGKWDGLAMWLLRIICGLKVESRGDQYIDNGSVIYASKHQSALETFYLGNKLMTCAFTIKRSLYWIPIFGWFLARSGMVGIDRKSGPASFKKMIREASAVKLQGRPFLLFPEGTRRAVNAEPAYKSGVYFLYKELNIPVIPIAHNAGMFWNKENLAKTPGTAVVEFLKPIEVGLDKKQFMAVLIERIETASNALAKEAQKNQS